MLKYTIEEFAELLGTKPAKPNSPIYHEPPIVILGIKKSDPVQTKQLVLPNQNNMTIKGTAEGLFNDDGEFVKGTFTYEDGMVDEGEFYRFGLLKGKRTFPNGDYAYGEFAEYGFLCEGKYVVDYDGELEIDLGGFGWPHIDNIRRVGALLHGKRIYTDGTIGEGEFCGPDVDFGTIKTLDGKKYKVEYGEKYLISDEKE